MNGKTVKVWRWGRWARDRGVPKNVQESFETAVEGEDLAYAWRGGGQVGEMGEGVEQGQGGGGVQG